jgi:uncharacterized protein with PIN domain
MLLYFRGCRLFLAAAITSMTVACSDASLPNSNGLARSPVVASSRDGNAKQKLHRRNRFDWVGVAHNEAIEAFRQEMRDPTKGSKGFCKLLEEFLSRPERVPASERAASLRERAALAANAVTGLPACHANLVKSASLSSAAATVPMQSASATALFDQVLSAIELAESTTDLANRLHPILDASQNLNAEEQSLIAVVVSVAQNSAEYWEATNQAFAQDAVNRYGDCTQAQVVSGASFDIALAHCLNSALYDQPVTGPPRARPLGRMAGNVPLPTCGPDPGSGLKKIGAADVKGAWSGFFSGAILGGRAVEGALIGGGGASIGAALGLAIQQYICIMTS